MKSKLPDFANQNFRVYAEQSEHRKWIQIQTQMQSRLSEVSGADPHNSCTQKQYQPSRSTNFTNITVSAIRNKIVGNTKICFIEVSDSLLATKDITKESYSLLRNSLGCESIPPHFHRVRYSSNHFPTSLSLLLPLRRRSATCTNFPWLTTRLEARRAT
jgi:hypothetical protein